MQPRTGPPKKVEQKFANLPTAGDALQDLVVALQRLVRDHLQREADEAEAHREHTPTPSDHDRDIASAHAKKRKNLITTIMESEGNIET